MSEKEVKTIINHKEVTNVLEVTQATELCKEIDTTLSDIKVLAEKKKQYSDLEKEIKPLSEKIKQAMLNNKAKSCDFDGLKLSITFQNRDTMDEDKLVELLESRGLTDAIITVRKPNPDVIPQLIANGSLTEQDLLDCTIENRVPVLSFPRAKKSKTEPTVNIPVNKDKIQMF